MIRHIAAALLIASPAAANVPPSAGAVPYYLAVVACSAAGCDARYRAVYVESATACATTAVTLLPQIVRDGEWIERWWCE